jgi:hypothetical protein
MQPFDGVSTIAKIANLSTLGPAEAVSCEVIVPSLIPRNPGERVKTNRRARELSRALDRSFRISRAGARGRRRRDRHRARRLYSSVACATKRGAVGQQRTRKHRKSPVLQVRRELRQRLEVGRVVLNQVSANEAQAPTAEMAVTPPSIRKSVPTT